MVVNETHLLNELTWGLLPGHFIMISMAFVSIFGTINIVVATWNTPHLHGTCNYLIALNALADSSHQLTQIIHGIIMFTKDGYISRLPCTYWNTVCLIGANTGMLGVFIIGVDRLLSVVAPTIYRNFNKILYHIFIFIIIAVFNGILLGLIYDYAIKNPDEKTLCLLPEIMGGTSGSVWFSLCIILNLSTILCYLTLGIILKYNTKALSATRKIFKPIKIITIMIFFGWTIASITVVVYRFVQYDWKIHYHTSVYFGIFVQIACTSNYFILFEFSSDYRPIFKRYLNFISKTFFGRKAFSEISNVTPVYTLQRKSIITLT